MPQGERQISEQSPLARRNRALFNSTRRLVAILTPDGRNVETNPIGYAFTGLDAEQT